MKERIKNDLPMLIGIIIAMLVVDGISKKSIDWVQTLIKIIVGIVLYLCFRFIEFRKKK